MSERPTGRMFVTEGRMDVLARDGMQDITVNRMPLGSLLANQLGVLGQGGNGRHSSFSLGKVRIWIQRLDK